MKGKIRAISIHFCTKSSYVTLKSYNIYIYIVYIRPKKGLPILTLQTVQTENRIKLIVPNINMSTARGGDRPNGSCSRNDCIEGGICSRIKGTCTS